MNYNPFLVYAIYKQQERALEQRIEMKRKIADAMGHSSLSRPVFAGIQQRLGELLQSFLRNHPTGGKTIARQGACLACAGACQ